jgi:hypothetical protein
VKSWIRIRIILQITSQNVWNMSLFEHFFKALSLYWEAKIRIRISDKLDPDPHQSDAEPQHWSRSTYADNTAGTFSWSKVRQYKQI